MAPSDIAPAALPSVPLDERRTLLAEAGLYFVLAGDDTVLYVGKTESLQQRWQAHHRLKQLNEYGGCAIAWLHAAFAC